MIFVSACLVGKNCKYNGGNNKNDNVLSFLEGKEFIEICPETFGGLSIPRDPSEIINSNGDEVLKGKAKVISKCGKDVTKNYIDGAKMSFDMAKKYNPELVILKAKSPSCGVGKIYDGSFSGVLKDGNGVAAQLFINNGYKVITEKDL